MRLVELICHQGFQISVGDRLFLIRQAFEPLKGFFKIGVAEGVAQVSQACPEGMPAGVFPNTKRLRLAPTSSGRMISYVRKFFSMPSW